MGCISQFQKDATLCQTFGGGRLEVLKQHQGPHSYRARRVTRMMLKTHNHYVPRLYLKRWAGIDSKVGAKGSQAPQPGKAFDQRNVFAKHDSMQFVRYCASSSALG